VPKVRVLRPHAKTNGLGVWRRGDVYEDFGVGMLQRVGGGFIELLESRLETKGDPVVYSSPKISVVSRSSNWYIFSDGEKVLGKRKAADYLQCTLEELEAHCEHLDAR
jgi:hypothetical protein